MVVIGFDVLIYPVDPNYEDEDMGVSLEHFHPVDIANSDSVTNLVIEGVRSSFST